jgi:peptidoglycan hydrolase-like protein with peptidoglycan-binding domain
LATRYIQSKLGISVDGVFGNQTRQAVVNWQRNHGLYSDGVVGQRTWASFLNN